MSHNPFVDVCGWSIARLVPVGDNAERAFDWLMKHEELSMYHRSFIQYQRRGATEPPDYASTRQVVKELNEPVADLSKIYHGFFQLSFSNPRSNTAKLVWRIGRGRDKFGNTDRDVDLLITPPGKPTAGVAPVHALVQFHSQSGSLMLTGVDNDHPIRYQLPNGILNLYNNDKHVLCQIVNRFSLGALGFELIFDTHSDEEYQNYIGLRNQLFKHEDRPVPHPCISALPRRPYLQIGQVIIHDTISNGAFGVVSAAVHARTGEPMAVKESVIKTKKDADAFESELFHSVSFTGEIGLLQALSHQCEHGKPKPCGKYSERAYVVFPLALRDFYGQDWLKTSLQNIIKLLRGPLEGLGALHRKGCMHRDVSVGNILIISDDPPTAVLCDYGKTIKAQNANYPYLGPIETTAPEIKPHGHEVYDNKIDVWSFGHVCCKILFPRARFLHGKIDLKMLAEINQELEAYGRRGGLLHKQFAHLVRCTMVWNPAQRFTVAQALSHICFQTAGAVLPQGQKDSKKRPSKDSHVDTLGRPVSTLEAGSDPQQGLPRSNPPFPHLEHNFGPEQSSRALTQSSALKLCSPALGSLIDNRGGIQTTRDATVPAAPFHSKPQTKPLAQTNPEAFPKYPTYRSTQHSSLNDTAPLSNPSPRSNRGNHQPPADSNQSSRHQRRS